MATAKEPATQTSKPNMNTRVPPVVLPLSDIYIDPSWNSRSHIVVSADEENTRFEGLRASLASRGQDTAVIVRPTPPELKRKEKHMLVAGYRRCAAIDANAKDAGEKNPTVLAEVRVMTEGEARSLNMRENLLREDISVPDLAWAINELVKAGHNQEGIAAEIGRTQGYVSKLNKIVKMVKPEIFAHWRADVVPLKYEDMLNVASVDAERQQEYYNDLLKKRVEGSQAPSEEDKAKAKLEGLKAKAKAFGFILGQIQQQLGEDDDNYNFSGMNFSECIELIVAFPATGFDARKKKAVANACKDGYEEGLIPEEEEEEDEEEGEEEGEEAEKPKGKRAKSA